MNALTSPGSLTLVTLFVACGAVALEWVRRDRGLPSRRVALVDVASDVWPQFSTPSYGTVQRRIVAAVKRQVIPGITGDSIVPHSCCVGINDIDFEALEPVLPVLIEHCEVFLGAFFESLGAAVVPELAVVADGRVARGAARALSSKYTSGSDQPRPGRKEKEGTATISDASTRTHPIDIAATRPSGGAQPACLGTLAPALTIEVDGRPITLGPMVNGAAWTVGRDPMACDLFVTASSVSAHHLELIVDGGVLWARDLDSLNGTSLDGRPLGSEQVRVTDGDRFMLGGTGGAVINVIASSPPSTATERLVGRIAVPPTSLIAEA